MAFSTWPGKELHFSFLTICHSVLRSVFSAELVGEIDEVKVGECPCRMSVKADKRVILL